MIVLNVIKRNYPWLICGCGAFIALCNVGLTTNGFYPFIAFIEESGYSGTQGSALLTIRCITSFLAMGITAHFYKRISYRVGLFLACTFTGAGLFAMSVAKNYMLYVVGAVLMGVAYAVGGMIPLSVLITRWFRHKKATAIALCTAGTGISSMIAPQIITPIAENRSLPAAFQSMGVVALFIGIVALVLVRDYPEQIHSLPLGEGAEEPLREAKSVQKRHQMPQSTHKKMVVAITLLGGVTMATSGHFSVLFISEGYSKELAAAAYSLMGITLILSKSLFGMVTDRIGAERSSAIFLMVLFCGVNISAFSGYARILTYLSVLTCAMGYPPSNIGPSIWAQDLTDEMGYQKVLQSYQMAYALGGGLCSFIPGAVFDLTGSYIPVYLCSGWILLVILGIIRSAYRERRRIPAVCLK